MSSKMGRKGFCFVLWLGFTCAVRCQVCPRAEDISPCTCKQYPMLPITTCANITDINTLYEVFGKNFDFPINQFVLTDSNVMYLPASSVADKKFQGLRIENTAMTSVFDGQPGQTDNLVNFRLINVRLLRGLEWNFFSSFTNLSRLEIKNTEVKKLGREFKDNIYKGLKDLEVSNAKMSVLEDGVFHELFKLEGLEISRGKIKFLKRSMFPNQPRKLWLLNFSGNLLATLPPDIFDNMPNLLIVTLLNNQFTTLSEDIFGDLYRRAEVSLNLLNNPMVCDCKVRWFLPKLRFRSIFGECVDPPVMRNASFDIMKEEDFSYCNVL